MWHKGVISSSDVFVVMEAQLLCESSIVWLSGLSLRRDKRGTIVSQGECNQRCWVDEKLLLLSLLYLHEPSNKRMYMCTWCVIDVIWGCIGPYLGTGWTGDGLVCGQVDSHPFTSLVFTDCCLVGDWNQWKRQMV